MRGSDKRPATHLRRGPGDRGFVFVDGVDKRGGGILVLIGFSNVASQILRYLILALMSLAVTPAVTRADEAANPFAGFTYAQGGEGGEMRVNRCNGGTFLVGVVVRFGAWIDAIGRQCAPVDSAGHWAGEPVPSSFLKLTIKQTQLLTRLRQW